MFTLPLHPPPAAAIGAAEPPHSTSSSPPLNRRSEQEDSTLERQGTVETISTTATAKSPRRSRWPFRRSSSQFATASTPSQTTSPTRPPSSNVNPRDVQSQASSRTNSFPLAPANDYGGFCKGAYYLQAGLFADGVKIRNMSTAKTGESWYWGCRNTKCVFESPALKIRKEFFFDDSLREFAGLKYRWAFLAKAHVAIGKTKDRIYNYRCIFCLLRGKEAPVIARIRPFLEHVAQHRGEVIDETILTKTICINDRVATDDDYFDINLPPLENAAPEVDEHETSSSPPATEKPPTIDANPVEVPSNRGGLGIADVWSQSGDGDDIFDPWKDP